MLPMEEETFKTVALSTGRPEKSFLRSCETTFLDHVETRKTETLRSSTSTEILTCNANETAISGIYSCILVLEN